MSRRSFRTLAVALLAGCTSHHSEQTAIDIYDHFCFTEEDVLFRAEIRSTRLVSTECAPIGTGYSLIYDDFSEYMYQFERHCEKEEVIFSPSEYLWPTETEAPIISSVLPLNANYIVSYYPSTHQKHPLPWQAEAIVNLSCGSGRSPRIRFEPILVGTDGSEYITGITFSAGYKFGYGRLFEHLENYTDIEGKMDQPVVLYESLPTPRYDWFQRELEIGTVENGEYTINKAVNLERFKQSLEKQ